jgi:4-alpha-glucanotransferase
MEDALALIEQPNLPGTTTEHPNWRRRMPADTGELLARDDVTARIATINQARTA